MTGSSIVDYQGATPLHIAACIGDEESVNVLLDCGAQIDSLNNDWYTPLHCAVESDKALVAKLLLQRGANPQRRTFKNETLGMLAVTKGNLELLHELEAYGLDFTVQDIDGESYIYRALQSRQTQVLAFCVSKSFEVSTNSTYSIKSFDAVWCTSKLSTFVLNCLTTIDDAAHLEYLGFATLLGEKGLQLLRKVLKQLGPGHRALINIDSRGEIHPRTPL